MKGQSRTNQERMEEISALKQRIQELEKSEAELKRIENALRESEEYFRAITENASDMVFIVNAQGKITYASPSIERFVGYHPNELIGKSSFYLILPEDHQRAREDFSRVLLTKDTVIPNSFRVRHRDGTERIFEGVGKNLMDNPVIRGFVMNVRDVTDRRHAENGLKESERKLQDILHGSPIPAFVMGKDHKVIYWNKALEKLSGIMAEEVIGKADHWRAFYKQERPCMADILVDEDLKKITEWYPDKHKKSDLLQDAYEALDFFPDLGDGGKWLRFTAAAIRDSQGCLLGAVETLEDITRSKRSEDALRESEDRFRAVADSALDAVIVIDWEGNVAYWSPSAERIFGYSAMEMMGKNVHEFLLPKRHRKAFERGFEAFQRTGKGDAIGKVLELTACRKKGTEIPIEITVSSITMKGKFWAAAIIRDISERKKAEEALKDSEKLYRSVIDNIRDTFYRADTNGKLIMVSPSGTTLLGYDSVEEMIGLDIAKSIYVNPGDRKNILSAIAERGFVTDFEVRLKRRDGTPVEVSTSSHKYFDENGILLGIEGILRDISKRKNTEKALRSSEERFSKAFHLNPAPAIISTIEDGRYVDVNNGFLLMLGYSRDEMIGRTASELNVWVNFDDRNKMARKLAEQGSLRGELLHLQTKNGDLRSVLVSTEIITLNDNKFILSIFDDITDRRRIENHLRQTQKMEAIGTLAGGIAHDFNNILGVIIGNTEIAQLHTDSEKLRHYLDQVLRASDRAKDLVQQILAFSRQREREKKPLLLAFAIKEGVNLLRSTLPTTIRINTHIITDSAAVLADPTQIHQVLMNLCTNAAHAMRDKGGTLTIRLDQERLNNRGRHRPPNLIDGDYALLTVQDTGHGMDDAILNRIFDPFFTTKGPGEGTGLGLSVVYGIVQNHGGAIDVTSAPGKGTTFTVYFPLVEKVEAVREMAAGMLPGGSERILVVDDEAILADVVHTMLKSLGYDATARTSSVEALEAFRARPNSYDLVITDMTMPNMRGDDLARELLKIRPDIPIILCTGFSEMISEEKAKILGIRRFIMKPIFKKDIARTIREILDT